MAVKLRLSRFGKRGAPMYRLVAIDEHKRRDGRAIEFLGTYDPRSKDNKLIIIKDRIDYWLSVGATPSDTIKSLLGKLTKKPIGANS